jgi:hypothetical protein
MEEKVAKFEIGKILAVVIVIIVVAVVASMVFQPEFFQGKS